MGAGATQQLALAPRLLPACERRTEPVTERRCYLEALADLEGVGVFAPLRLGEAPQGHLIVEHGRWVGEGLRRR